MATNNTIKPVVVPAGVIWDEPTGGVNYIYGTSGSETLTGTGSADVIFGGAGGDALNGGGGDDVLNGGAGFDTLNGGSGIDTASYVDTTSAVQVQLGGTGLGSATVTGDQGDWLLSIENVWGSAFSDYIAGDQFINQLSGGDGSDTLFGYGGADVLSGGTGNDTLNGGAGADKLDGGENVDTASYAGSNLGVQVSLLGGVGLGGDASGDVLLNIENLEGSSFSDTLRGDGNYNILTGGDGADKLFGEGGADTLIGGRGSDTLTGGIGRDTFVISTNDMGTGVDTVTDFQTGFDHIDLRSFNFTDRAGTGEVAVGPSNGAVWYWGLSGQTQLVFDPQDSTLYKVFVQVNGDGELFVQDRAAIVTLTGISTLSGADLILS